MSISFTRSLMTSVLMLVVFTFTPSAFAQGTATGPATSHTVQPGPLILIGSDVDPIPIDLDPTGPPWIKGISDPDGVIDVDGPIQMVETILNAGDEPWYDWHELILDPPFGLPQSTWIDVKLSVNGNPIGFTATGLGTPELDLDSFSQPVLPGDILTIDKYLTGYPTTPASGGPFLRIIEYPTPEPASAALLGLGSICVLGKRRWRG